MECIHCHNELRTNRYRQTKFRIVVCENNCYNWFHGDQDCLRNWIKTLSGLDDIDTSKNEMTNEDFLAIDFSKIREYTDYICPSENCDAKVVGMKTLNNVDGTQRRRRWNRFTDTSELYDIYYKESGQWRQTWKRYIHDQVKDLKKSLSWRCFDDTKKFIIEGDGTWRNRRRTTTERRENKRIFDHSRSYYYRRNLSDTQLAKLKEINERRRFALVLMHSDPSTDITKLVGYNKEANTEAKEIPKPTIPDPTKENEEMSSEESEVEESEDSN